MSMTNINKPIGPIVTNRNALGGYNRFNANNSNVSNLNNFSGSGISYQPKNSLSNPSTNSYIMPTMTTSNNLVSLQSGGYGSNLDQGNNIYGRYKFWSCALNNLYIVIDFNISSQD